MHTISSSESQKLFVVLLGGSAPRSNTELHDIVFVVGDRIESTYSELLGLWFGNADGLHIDAWAVVDIVDGYRVRLREAPSESPSKLFFVNMGAYIPGQLVELHANEFFVSDDKQKVVKRAKEQCLAGMVSIHRDYLYDVDECLEVGQVGRLFVHLEPTSDVSSSEPVCAYHPLPKEVIAAFKARSDVGA